MKLLKEPYYKALTTKELRRFDERDTGFSRGVIEGNKFALIHENSVRNLEKLVPGKTILDHSLYAAGRTVDYILRKNALARETEAIYNKFWKLKNIDPAAMTKIIKETARWFGADLVGVAELNSLWIYTHWGEHNAMYTHAAEPGEPIDIPSTYNRVIVVITEMDYRLIRWSPAIEPASAMGYSKSAWCASSLATFIVELGYHAIPCGNEIGASIPMAIDAGLGEAGRNGLLLTREFGPRARIGKVFTDLPLLINSPIDIGIQNFCAKCDRCARHCPSQAITFGNRTDKAIDKSNSEGILKWPVNAMKCLDWWVKNGTGCSVCIRVCPWNKPDNIFHHGVRFLAEQNILIKTLVKMDKLVGYGKQAINKSGLSYSKLSNVAKIE